MVFVTLTPYFSAKAQGQNWAEIQGICTGQQATLREVLMLCDAVRNLKSESELLNGKITDGLKLANELQTQLTKSQSDARGKEEEVKLLKARLEQVETQLLNANKSLASVNAQLGRAELNIAQLSGVIKLRDDDLRKASEERDRLQNEVMKRAQAELALQREMAANKEKIQEINQKLSAARNDAAKQAVLTRQLDEAMRIAQSTEVALKKSQEESSAVKAQLDEKQKLVTNKEVERVALQTELEARSAQVSGLKARISNLEQEKKLQSLLAIMIAAFLLLLLSSIVFLLWRAKRDGAANIRDFESAYMRATGLPDFKIHYLNPPQRHAVREMCVHQAVIDEVRLVMYIVIALSLIGMLMALFLFGHFYIQNGLTNQGWLKEFVDNVIFKLVAGFLAPAAASVVAYNTLQTRLMESIELCREFHFFKSAHWVPGSHQDQALPSPSASTGEALPPTGSS